MQKRKDYICQSEFKKLRWTMTRKQQRSNIDQANKLREMKKIKVYTDHSHFMICSTQITIYIKYKLYAAIHFHVYIQ